MRERRLANFLGWFSLALGAVELAATRQLCDALDINGREGLVRAFGAREVAAGVGLLAQQDRQAPWLWGRVAGDALDLGTLLAALPGNRRRGFVAAAIGSVAAVTVLDILAGIRVSDREALVAA